MKALGLLVLMVAVPAIVVIGTIYLAVRWGDEDWDEEGWNFEGEDYEDEDEEGWDEQ
jgi:hypothetical protein